MDAHASPKLGHDLVVDELQIGIDFVPIMF
jgi:hypothetical protein